MKKMLFLRTENLFRNRFAIQGVILRNVQLFDDFCGLRIKQFWFECKSKADAATGPAHKILANWGAVLSFIVKVNSIVSIIDKVVLHSW